MTDTTAPAPQGNPTDPVVTENKAVAPPSVDAPAAPPATAADKPAVDPPPADATKAWHEDPAIQEYATKRATGADGKVDQKLADKTLARLKRFQTLNEALDWAFNSDKKIADGTWKKEQGKAPETPEELAAYREANGIPETPEGFTENLPDGLVLGDEDKPIFDGYAKRIHEVAHKGPTAMVQETIKWYNEFVDEQEGLRQQANVAAKEEAETQLKAELGPQYTATINMIDAMIKTMPEDLQAELYQSTKPDGSQIMNNPAMLKWLATQAKALNFTGTVLPSGQQAAKTVTDEIGQIEAAMKDMGSAYYKGPKTAGGETVMRARYRELLDQQASLTRKAG